MRLPDRVTHLEPGVSITLEKRLSADDVFCAPGASGPCPEMLLVELCAQTAGLLNRQDADAPPRPGMLCAIPEFTFHRRVQAGDTLIVEASAEGELGPLFSIRCRITCKGEECAAGRLTLYVRTSPANDRLP